MQEHFDAIAQKYDLMNTLLSFGIHYWWKRKAVRLLGLQAGERVLDVCGGTGDLSILAAQKVGPAGQVALYDLNRAMLETGRGKCFNSRARKKILYVQGDAEEISFQAECFDAVMVGFGIRNLIHREQGLCEMYRVLKPGGRFLCLEFSRPTAPWLRWLYDWYSFHCMPGLGSLVAGSREAYLYLPKSIRLFPSPAELTRMLQEIGFQEITCRPLSNGIAVVHVGMKGGDR